MRDPTEEAAALAAFQADMQARPDAGLIIGTVEMVDDNDRCDVNFENVDCGPVHLVGAAEAFLHRAVEKMLAMTPRPMREIQACEAARAALGFASEASN